MSMNAVTPQQVRAQRNDINVTVDRIIDAANRDLMRKRALRQPETTTLTPSYDGFDRVIVMSEVAARFENSGWTDVHYEFGNYGQVTLSVRYPRYM